MKKILLIIFTLLSINIIAQVEGIPFNFCTLSGVVYNPGIHNNIEDDKWVVTINNSTKSEKVFLQSRFEEEHPNHTIIVEATPTYNCHGYSFGIFQGTIPCKIKWFEEFCNDAFIEITDTNAIQYGDIAVVRKYTDYGHTILDYESEHSSIVVNQDTLISKWGEGPLTKHHKYDLINIDGFDNGSTVYTYYRRVANTEIYGPDTFNGNGSYTFVPNVTPSSCRWNIEPYTMFQQSFSFGQTASLSYKSNLTHISPKSVITFTFQYGCDNSYTTKREIELEIPTSTLSGTITSDGFIVGDNAVVTVTGEIRMEENSKIIIKPGGKLIVDGGLLTSACPDKMWQGIQVWGIDSLHQYLSNGQYLQGVLELRNGATIENAVCAVDLWNPLDEHSEGGIVWAEDATFRNNAKAVRAINYSNYSPGSSTEAHNMSWFRNCSFIIDSDYIGSHTFHNHVELTNVDGIKFFTCNFYKDNAASNMASSTSAIYSSGAGFIVTSTCSSPLSPCPEENIHRSVFNGFDNAIYAIGNGGSARTFSVSGSEFWSNERGIYAINTGYATIIKNIFNIGSSAQCSYGVYVDGVTNFCIEENNFLKNTSTANRTYGIAVKHSGSYNDIYLNHFNNLYCGNISIGNNIVSGNNGLGLTYTCNTNSGNTHDFGVLTDGVSGNIDNSQGSSSLAAANTFSASQYHFYNKGDNNLTYYYKGSGDKKPTKKYGITLAAASKDHECKSHYDIGGGGGDIAMSVGMTDSLKNRYESSFSSYNRLNGLSAYKIDKDSTQKMQQEAQMSMLQRECLLVAGDIVRSNLNKEERDFDELREWIGKNNDICSDRMIIASYIQQKDFVNAIALAKTLPNTYKLQGEELDEFYDYLEIIRLYESLCETDRSTLQLSEQEIALLEDMAENGAGASKSMAEAILAENRGIPGAIIPLCPTIPNFILVIRGTDETEMTSDTAFEVELSPNPATTNVEVSYTLPEGMTSATLVMTNTLGVNVMTAHLDGNNKTTLSLEELPSGIYFYTIRCGENVKTGKLIKK